MKLPTIQGLIDRRMLINFRVDPATLARQLPDPFRPVVVNGFAMAGICLIRLKHIRPVGLPACVGIRSENAAHRAAVEWDDNGTQRTGVFIWRRDTNSRLNALAGGRIFPGRHHHARFDVRETDTHLSLAMHSRDDTVIRVEADKLQDWPGDSIFDSRDEASRFFRAGSIGYSPANSSTHFDGLELACENWHVEALSVQTCRSSFFDDAARFPPGSIRPDNALLMRNIPHTWHAVRTLPCVC